MTRKNGVAVLQARIEKELLEIKKVVELVEKNLAGISQKIPEDIVVVGFAGFDIFSGTVTVSTSIGMSLNLKLKI